MISTWNVNPEGKGDVCFFPNPGQLAKWLFFTRIESLENIVFEMPKILKVLIEGNITSL